MVPIASSVSPARHSTLHHHFRCTRNSSNPYQGSCLRDPNSGARAHRSTPRRQCTCAVRAVPGQAAWTTPAHSHGRASRCKSRTGAGAYPGPAAPHPRVRTCFSNLPARGNRQRSRPPWLSRGRSDRFNAATGEAVTNGFSIRIPSIGVSPHFHRCSIETATAAGAYTCRQRRSGSQPPPPPGKKTNGRLVTEDDCDGTRCLVEELATWSGPTDEHRTQTVTSADRARRPP